MDIGTTTRYFYLHPDTDVFEEHSRKLTDHPTGNLVIVHEHHEGHGLITYQFDIQLVGCAVHMQKVFDLIRRFVTITTAYTAKPMPPAPTPAEEIEEESNSYPAVREAMRVAVDAIREVPGVKTCAIPADSDGGEIKLQMSDGTAWVLQLNKIT